MTDQTMAPEAIMKAPAGRFHRAHAILSKVTGNKRLRAWAQPVTYLGLGMLAVVYTLLGFLIVNDRREAFDNALRQGANLVRILDQSYSHIFHSVDTNLLFLRHAYLQSPATFDLTAWLSDPAIRTDLAFDYVIIDARGRAVAATMNPGSRGNQILGQDFSDRDYFQRQKDTPTDELFFSAPLKLRLTGKTAVPLTRRLTGSDGTFAGVVVALLDPLAIGRTGADLNLGALGSVGLTGFDGVIRTRSVDGKTVADLIGIKLLPDAGILRHVAAAPKGHFWNRPGQFDNVSRLVSYRVVGDYPLIATVAVTEAEVFGHVNNGAKIYWSIALLLTIAIFGGVKWGVAREQKLMAATSAILDAQQDLKKSQERSRLVEDAVNDGIWDWDIENDNYYRSPSWMNILGLGNEKLANDAAAFQALLHPDDAPMVAEAMRAHLENGKPYSLEFRLRHKDGDYRWVRARGKAHRDASGRPLRMLGTIADITERQRAEVALKESHGNLARAEEMACLGHTRLDLVTGAYTWSAGVYRIMRKSPADFVPTPESALEILHPDERAAHAQDRADVIAGLAMTRRTVRAIVGDGEIIHVEFWSVPIRDKNGVIVGKFSTMQDVTDKKRAEAEIEESRDNLARAERLALLGHFRSDYAETLVWSEGVYRIFGLSPDSYTPTLRGALDLILPEDRHLLKQARDQAISGHEIPHLTLRARRRDGQIIDLEYWATPVRDSTGAVTGVFGTVQDVTIRRRAEELLARANQELEARVSERTIELAQEMRRREEAQMTLGQMQKMEAVGQLTAGIAHDFNNLLAVIGGSLEFIDNAASRGLTADPELIDAAVRATRRGRELVRRLLAFARQTPLRAETTAIDQLVLDTLRLLQRTLGQSIDMVTRLDAHGAAISVDRNQLANALLNLALNARDAMPDGGQLTIATDCRPVDASATKNPARWPTGEEVCITISDTGTGMSKDVLSRAVEPFYTTKADGLGSGLGLSMVQGFVEQSGGQLDIQSEPRRGTTITIRLPRIALPGQAEEVERGLHGAGAEREKTVLLVEDDPDVRVVTTAQLRHLGYRVHAVANGMEAIDLIASPANIDITLTDIVLPGGLDGVALVKEAMQARPRMGVLCMSGYDPVQKHRKWLSMQNITFLEKPFSTHRLAQALDAALVE